MCSWHGPVAPQRIRTEIRPSLLCRSLLLEEFGKAACRDQALGPRGEGVVIRRFEARTSGRIRRAEAQGDEAKHEFQCGRMTSFLAPFISALL